MIKSMKNEKAVNLNAFRLYIYGGSNGCNMNKNSLCMCSFRLLANQAFAVTYKTVVLGKAFNFIYARR